MITQELIAYMRAELAKGKTRDEIHTALINGGGWTEADLNEAFRVVIPMQTIVTPVKSNVTPTIVKVNQTSTMAAASPYKVFSKGVWTFILILLLIVWAVVMWWIYKPEINNLLSKLIHRTPATIVQLTAPVTSTIPENNLNIAVTPAASIPTDCGVTAAPDSTKPATYANNSVLACLGNSALVCTNATAVLTNPIFPTIAQISANENTCDLTLSYPADSTLVSQTGVKMAGQYITCPLSAIGSPNVSDSALYGSEIYAYGTTGVFLENNLDKTKILALGCSGPFIDSMIASYNMAGTK